MEALLIPAATLSASLALFVVHNVLVRRETVAGRRLVAGRVRGWLDRVVGMAARLRRAALNTLRWRPVERVVDPSVANAVFRHATRTPLTVTHTDNHLSKIREHKIETALTPAQKRKRKKQKLEERF